MKFLTTLLLLVFLRANAYAGTAQVNNVVQLGGAQDTTASSIILPYASLSNVIILSAFVQSSTVGNFLMLSRWSSTGSGGQYQVTTGKTFRVVGIWYNVNGTASALTLGYGTAALGSDNTGTPPTGVVYYSSGASVYALALQGSSVWRFLPMSAEFPALSYPFVKFNTGAYVLNVILIGVEQ